MTREPKARAFGRCPSGENGGCRLKSGMPSSASYDNAVDESGGDLRPGDASPALLMRERTNHKPIQVKWDSIPIAHAGRTVSGTAHFCWSKVALRVLASFRLTAPKMSPAGSPAFRDF